MTKIAQVGEPILRQIAQPVKDIYQPEIQALIDTLMTTADKANGVGIAAPQIGKSCRIFIVASRPNPRYPHAPWMQPTAMINHKIISHSEEIVKDWEGCLSVCGKRGLVPRYQAITVEYLTRDGKLETREFTDFVARIIQHESDHLDGILFIDRLKNSQDIYSEEEYQKIISQENSGE
jgi:peptide deformylase